MMGREEDDLGEMRPSSFARAGPSNLGGAGAGFNNLGGAGPSGIGGAKPTKECKKRQFGSRGSKHRKKDEPFFSQGYPFCIHKTIVDLFQGVSDTRLTLAFLSNNIQKINHYKRFV
jgi:hypothetical protein